MDTYFAIRAGTLIDGTESAPAQDMLVLGKNDRITEITKFEGTKVPAGATFIDASDQFVLPGLIDAHVHILGSGEPGESRFFTSGAEYSIPEVTLECYKNACKSMEAGWTTLRDVACRHYADVSVRNAINSGSLVGPRLYVCGLGITSTAGHMDSDKFLAPHFTNNNLNAVADSPDEARKAVRQNLRFDVDLIKFNATLTEHVRRYKGYCAPEMTEATMQALIEEAHWHGRKVTAHCYGGDGATWAVRSGIDGIEHGFYLSDDHLRMMADMGTVLCPTLSVVGRFRQHGKAALNFGGNVELLNAWREKAIAAAWDTTRRAHELGVKIICGDDVAMPYVKHGTNAYELEMLVEAGLTPKEALISATSDAAEAIDFTDVGSLQPGKYLDAVIVDANPLDDITVLQDLNKIPFVVKGGEVVANRSGRMPSTLSA